MVAGPAFAQMTAPSPSPSPRGYTSSPVDTAHGDREAVVLWPGGAPGALGTAPEDTPKITVYRPTGKANGTAVLVCPGGGYHNLASDHEGKQVAEWLNGLGVTAFVLQYRVGPRYHHPVPLQDAQRAIRLVRARAQSYGVDPARVGILGFSAGGHLASTVATRDGHGDPAASDPADRLSARPDFAVLAYPVITMSGTFLHRGSRDNLIGDPADPKLAEEMSSERRVTATTPPTFLFHTADDATVPVENALAFYAALVAAHVPAELHVFPHGHHGIGLAQGDPVLSQWPALCAVWLKAGGFLP